MDQTVLMFRLVGLPSDTLLESDPLVSMNEAS